MTCYCLAVSLKSSGGLPRIAVLHISNGCGQVGGVTSRALALSVNVWVARLMLACVLF